MKIIFYPYLIFDETFENQIGTYIYSLCIIISNCLMNFDSRKTIFDRKSYKLR